MLNQSIKWCLLSWHDKDDILTLTIYNIQTKKNRSQLQDEERRKKNETTKNMTEEVVVIMLLLMCVHAIVCV